MQVFLKTLNVLLLGGKCSLKWGGEGFFKKIYTPLKIFRLKYRLICITIMLIMLQTQRYLKYVNVLV